MVQAHPAPKSNQKLHQIDVDWRDVSEDKSPDTPVMLSVNPRRRDSAWTPGIT
jgi:hypothetical protein